MSRIRGVWGSVIVAIALAVMAACARVGVGGNPLHLRVARYSYVQADSYTSIQAAIDSLPSDGGTVYLSAHAYTITSPIYVPGNVSLGHQLQPVLHGQHGHPVRLQRQQQPPRLRDRRHLRRQRHPHRRLVHGQHRK
jgi:hypothetical protein